LSDYRLCLMIRKAKVVGERRVTSQRIDPLDELRLEGRRP